MKQPHLLICISGHGFGHVAQTAPVVNALKQLLPDLRLTIRSSVPLGHLRSRMPHEFHYLEEAVDPGMQMVSALEVDEDASFKSYLAFHAEWNMRIQAESDLIAALTPDLVLTNVAYLPLEGAARLGIPAVAMCSLNWADIFRDFCGEMSGAAQILEQIERAYQHADTFLRLTPAMPMPWMLQQRTLGPVAQPSPSRRDLIDKKLGLYRKNKLVLVSMGGIAMQFPIDVWPRIADVWWLVPDSWQSGREDCVPVGSMGLDFSEVLASCDILLTKPGYGSFVEAACAGVPVLYVKREAWPEQDELVYWLSRQGRCKELSAEALQTGNFGEALLELLNQEKPGPVEASGTQEAAQFLAALLRN